MTLLDHPIWRYVAPYASITNGRDNVDFLRLPAQLRDLALGAVANCVSCARVISPMRARAKSGRSRIAGSEVEWRLYYAPTCPEEADPGCARTRFAQEHKERVKGVLRG